MAHYAYINYENVVVEVITGRNENETVDGISDWEAWYAKQRDGLRSLRTSYNTRGGVHYDPETGEPSEDQSKAFRYNYAGLNFTYDPDADAFIPPKPHEDATLDTETYTWVMPEED